jgi:hypothetical protein
MIDRAGAPAPRSATRAGRKDLGAATAAVDDEVLTIVAQSGADDVPLRVRLANIDGVSSGDGQLAIALRDGTRLTLVCESPVELQNDLLVRCRTLPELTRTLRGFGSRRGSRGSRDSAHRDQQRFFAPLLDARRKAWGTREPTATIAAFDAANLASAFETILEAFARERHGDNGPARRALTAELVDLSEPLRDALDSLRRSADQATAATENLRLWRVWSTQLRVTFETADRVWLSLDAALDANPKNPTRP